MKKILNKLSITNLKRLDRYKNEYDAIRLYHGAIEAESSSAVNKIKGYLDCLFDKGIITLDEAEVLYDYYTGGSDY